MKLHGLNIEGYNIAFVGQAGTGKSSLINSIRLQDDKNVTLAEVGVEQCTAALTPYHHPTLSHVVFWDTPGK
jgi:predicted GTPase